MNNTSKLNESVIYSTIREHKKTLQYVADAMDIHRVTLSRKLSEETIQLNELRKIASILGIETNNLLNRLII